MFYNPGDVILLREGCRLANGNPLKDYFPDYIGQSAVIVLAQTGYSQVRKDNYCHYKLKLTKDFEEDIPFNYFKIFHDEDGICLDKSYPRNEKLKQLLKT